MLGRFAKTAAPLARGALAPKMAAVRPAFFAAPARTFAVPTTADKISYVTFLNKNGDRKRVPAFAGQTIYEVAIDHQVEIGDELTCHVILTPDSYAAYDTPMREETDMLGKFEDVAPTSRMASYIAVTEKIKETYVALTDYRDVFIP